MKKEKTPPEQQPEEKAPEAEQEQQTAAPAEEAPTKEQQLQKALDDKNALAKGAAGYLRRLPCGCDKRAFTHP